MSVNDISLQPVTPSSTSRKSNMYDNAKTWNPFKGCKFDCVYCRPSFQQQAERQKQRCLDCYAYAPHYHEKRLARIQQPAEAGHPQ